MIQESYTATKDEVIKDVEYYLNTTDYSVDSSYVPSNFALEFINFIKLVNGPEGEENESPVVHYKMLDKIDTPGSRKINLCHRGIGKTSIFAEYLVLYIATYGELPNIGDVSLGLYVSDSIQNGVKNLRQNLEYRYENSDFLRKFIPHTKFTDVRWEFVNAAGHVLIMKGYGAATGVRGAKELATRPQIAILDDLISDEDARSTVIISSIEDTVYKAVTHALHPKRNLIIWSGTAFNNRDPLYKAVASGAWQVNVFPVCEKFPCTKEEFKGSWEDRFTYEIVKDQYDMCVKSGRISSFNQELMLRIMSDEDRLISDSEIGWYKRSAVLNHKGQFNFYITTDFATSIKDRNDWSVISVWAINSAGDWFWVDGVCKRQLMNENIDVLFRMAQIYKPQGVGIEVSGQQGGFVTWIQEQMMERNIWFVLSSYNNGKNPGIRPSTDKFVRFNTIVPLFKAHKMFFPIEMKEDLVLQEAVSELSLASIGGFKSKHDDFIDTISMLSCLNAWRPSEEASFQYNGYTGVWEEEEEDAIVTRINSYIV